MNKRSIKMYILQDMHAGLEPNWQENKLHCKKQKLSICINAALSKEQPKKHDYRKEWDSSAHGKITILLL